MEFDSTFAEAEFITKADNIYIMLLTSRMTSNLKRVAHFLSEEVLASEQEQLNHWTEQGVRPIYGEMNIKESRVVEKQVLEDLYQVKVKMSVRYLESYVEKEIGEFVSGDVLERKEVPLLLTFQKKRDTKELGFSRKCPNCGATMDLNHSGVCPYCQQVFHQENYDWILVKIEKEGIVWD